MAKRKRRESIERPAAVGAPGAEVVQIVRRECGPRILLAFSRGKDSIAAWLAIRDHFEEVVPVFFYAVPGLSFVEESLSYFEERMGRRRSTSSTKSHRGCASSTTAARARTLRSATEAGRFGSSSKARSASLFPEGMR